MSANSAADSAAALPVAPPSRWSDLYSDALHSILRCASLAELSRVLAVSRRWSDAVMTMPPMHVTNEMGDTFSDSRLDPIRAVRPLQLTDFPAVRSRLARHVSSFGDSLYLDCVGAVAQYMPWMRSLSILVNKRSDPEPQQLTLALGRFNSLTHLEAEFGDLQDAWDEDACNSIIAVIGGLTTLDSVTLYLSPDVFLWLSFAPLIALPSLHTLLLTSVDEDLPPCTDSQIAEFRSMRSLKKLDVDATRDELLVRMLQPGHAFQWTELSWVEVTATLAALLGSLPTLTTLHATMQCPNVDFLSHLPQLTDVYLSSHLDEPVDPDALVRALSHCTHIRRLELHELQLNGDHLAQLLPCFPQLADLRLMYLDAVSSLRCLDTPALAASLTHLSLEAMSECPPSELVHLLNLRSLDSLHISDLADAVSDELKAQFVVPSPRFPYLHTTLDSVRME